VVGSYSERDAVKFGVRRAVRKAGWIGVAFFTAKGLLWLLVPTLAAYFTATQ
jgi:hypothetical protein